MPDTANFNTGCCGSLMLSFRSIVFSKPLCRLPCYFIMSRRSLISQQGKEVNLQEHTWWYLTRSHGTIWDLLTFKWWKYVEIMSSSSEYTSLWLWRTPSFQLPHVPAEASTNFGGQHRNPGEGDRNLPVGEGRDVWLRGSRGGGKHSISFCSSVLGGHGLICSREDQKQHFLAPTALCGTTGNESEWISDFKWFQPNKKLIEVVMYFHVFCVRLFKWLKIVIVCWTWLTFPRQPMESFPICSFIIYPCLDDFVG